MSAAALHTLTLAAQQQVGCERASGGVCVRVDPETQK